MTSSTIKNKLGDYPITNHVIKEYIHCRQTRDIEARDKHTTLAYSY